MLVVCLAAVWHAILQLSSREHSWHIYLRAPSKSHQPEVSEIFIRNEYQIKLDYDIIK